MWIKTVRVPIETNKFIELDPELKAFLLYL